MLKNLEKPNLSKVSQEKLLQRLSQKKLDALVYKSFSPYVFWDKVKYWPLPAGVKPEELWAMIKLTRKFGFPQSSPVQDVDGQLFTWLRVPGMEEVLHKIDLQLGGNLMDFGRHWDERSRHQLLTRGIMEEAISSSQLEGAHTTRKVAQRMLEEGRKPQTKDEKMIVNNYQAMRWIEEELKHRELDESLLLTLHEILTKDTLDDASEVGRFRRDEDNIVVGDANTNEVSFIPPPEKFLRAQLKIFLNYANGKLAEPHFVHPVVKAIVLHFWTGFLHPFVDGNGRLARALFYWYCLKQNYWAFAYLPLSSVIKKSPTQYRDAYVYSEQDDHDLTYFVDYNLRKIQQAMQEFESYVQRKGRENSQMAEKARDHYDLNDRQIQLLRFLHKNRGATTSITVYTKVYQVALMTARKDLLALKELGFLTTRKSGRVLHYSPTEKILELF